MMSYEVYKIMHLVGLLAVFSGLAALWGVSSTAPLERHPPSKRALAIIHGLGMTLLIVGGFGMLARQNLMQDGIPGWTYAKLAIWLFMGGSMTLAKRRASWGALKLLGLWIGAGALAAYLAIYKPF